MPWTRLEPKLEPIGQVEMNWAQTDPDDPNLKRCCAYVGPSQAKHGATRSCLAPRTETQHGELCFQRSVANTKNMWKTPSLTISYLVGNVPRVEPMWSSTWAEIASKWQLTWGQVVACWSQVGLKLEPGGLKYSGFLAKVGPKWSPYCCHVGSNRRTWTSLLPI